MFNAGKFNILGYDCGIREIDNPDATVMYEGYVKAGCCQYTLLIRGVRRTDNKVVLTKFSTFKESNDPKLLAAISILYSKVFMSLYSIGG